MKTCHLCLAAVVLTMAACTSPQLPETSDAEAKVEAKPRADNPASIPSSTGKELESLESLEAGIARRDTRPADAKVVRVSLSNQVIGEDGQTLGMPVGSFSPSDTVYAEIQSTGSAGDYNIYAKWVTSDGTVLADYGMRVAEAGPKRTVISLSKPDGWPLGTHSIELAINGKAEQVTKFEVR